MKASGIVGISAFVAVVLLAGMSCSDQPASDPGRPKRGYS